jgi:dolichyl-phosphate-mannose--protein O-mannosyl transferase
MVVLVVRAFHIEELLSNLRSRLSKSAVGERVSLRGEGWDIPAIYISVVFLFSWLPYVFIGRATYIYHFFLSVPLLCLALTYFINKYWHKPIGKVATIILFTVTVAMFVAFYPVISGAPATSEYIHNLKWFPSWFFAP